MEDIDAGKPLMGNMVVVLTSITNLGWCDQVRQVTDFSLMEVPQPL